MPEWETERERASCKYTFSPLHIFILTIAMIAQWVCMDVCMVCVVYIKSHDFMWGNTYIQRKHVVYTTLKAEIENGTEPNCDWIERRRRKKPHTHTWRLKSTCAGHDVEHTHFSAIKMVSVCHIQAVNKRKMIIVTMNEVRRGRMRYGMARKYSVTHVYNVHQLFAWCQHLILIGQLAIGQKLSFTEPNGPNEKKKLRRKTWKISSAY